MRRVGVLPALSDSRGRIGDRGGEVGVHQWYDAGALARRSGNTFHRPGPDVADREYPGHHGGEVRGRQPVGPQVLGDIPPGQHEAVLVEADLLRQPVALRLGTEQQEQAGRLVPGDLIGVQVADADPFQPALSAAVHDLRALPDADLGHVLHLAEQVVGHRGGHVGSSYEQGDRAGVPRQVQRCLPGRVAPTDDEDVAVLRLRCGAHRGAVVHAEADQLLDRVHAQAPVGNPGRDHHSSAADLAPSGHHAVRLVTDSGDKLLDGPAGEEARAEPDRLAPGALSQPHA